MIDYKNVNTKEQAPSLFVQLLAVIGICIFFVFVCFLTTLITPETNASTTTTYVK